MAKDPVCRIDVDERFAPDQSEYQGKVYFFCSPDCKLQFLRNQACYVVEERPPERRPRRKTAVRAAAT